MSSSDRICTLLFTTLILTACQRAPVENSCTPSLSEGTSLSDSTWRVALLQRINALPDSLWSEAAVYGVGMADSDLFTPYGGQITYDFRGFDAALVRMRVAGFRALAMDTLSDPDNKIKDVQISVTPGIPLSCS